MPVKKKKEKQKRAIIINTILQGIWACVFACSHARDPLTQTLRMIQL